MFEPIGFYVDCDDAECSDCHDPASWEGFESWDEPLAIFADSEADTPTHCHICHELIPHALTSDGYAYVREAVAYGTDAPTVAARASQAYVLEMWADEYLTDELEAIGVELDGA